MSGGDDDHDYGLANFDAKIEREQRDAERPIGQAGLPQYVGEPKPCTRPNASATQAERRVLSFRSQVVGADVDDAERDGRLDEAGGRVDNLQRGERQRDAVAERKGGDDGEQACEVPAEQHQADDEEDVIGTDCDVMVPDAVKALNTAKRPCREPVKKSTLVRPLFRISWRTSASSL